MDGRRHYHGYRGPSFAPVAFPPTPSAGAVSPTIAAASGAADFAVEVEPDAVVVSVAVNADPA